MPLTKPVVLSQRTGVQVPQPRAKLNVREVTMRRTFAFLLLSCLFVTGCEGLFTGARESKHPLAQAADGGFAPVKLQLSPDMNPIALNIHGSTISSSAENGLYNTYRATLSRNGQSIAAETFHINHPGSGRSDQGGPFRKTMMFATVTQSGEHEVTIVAVKPKEITIEQPMLEVRRNTQPPPR